MIWTILGVSVAILAFFCISVAETLVGKPIFENNRAYLALVLGAAGVAAWFLGRHLARGRQNSNAEGEEADSKQFVLLDLRYWGPMFLALGMITLFIRPLRSKKNEEVHLPPPPPPKPVAIVEVPAQPQPRTNAPVIFPRLKMQAVFLEESQPSTIIDGQSYGVGDHVGKATIKAISRAGVTLELDGEVRLLTFN
jgi:hypothetical protein